MAKPKLAHSTSSGKSRPGLASQPWALGLAVVCILAAVSWIALSGGSGGATHHPPVESQPVPTSIEDEEPIPLSESSMPALPGEGPVVVELEYLGAEAGQRLRPERSGSLEGRVLDENQAPIVDCVLTVRGGPQDGFRVQSDRDGRYLFQSLIPGTHFIELLAPRLPRVVRQHRVQHRVRSYRDFHFGRLLYIEMLVKDEVGKPLEGATVRTDLGVQEARSNADGIAAFGSVVSGPRVLVDVFADGFVPTRHELNFAPWQAQQGPVELPQLRKGADLRVVVKTWPGYPLPTITLVPRTDRPGPHQVIWENWHALSVKSDGSLLLKNVPSDRMVDVRAFHPAGVTDHARTVRPSLTYAASVQFIIRAGGRRIRGAVKYENGEPASGVQVTLEAAKPGAILASLFPGLDDSPSSTVLPVPAALRREWLTDESGKFDFAWGDHPKGGGHLILTARKPGYAPARREVRRVVSEVQLKLKKEAFTGSLQLAARDGGPLPAADQVQWFLDGERLEQADRLAKGFYGIVARRGKHILFREIEFFIDGRTEVPVR